MTYLLTAQEIKSNTSMGGNVDPDKFMHLLYDVQVLILEPTLGTKLYDKIIHKKIVVCILFACQNLLF